ncbi:MAG: hypothetical protein P8R42_13355 [Candidatus Binatia bacterium]|nr:hypothetical protein [Candidatus Binatia bacterium]
MAKKKSEKPARREVRPSSWALAAMAAVTLLLVYAGVSSGNWRGVVVTEIQVLVVGCAAWYGLR